MNSMEWRGKSGRKIEMIEGDITRIPVDAIVNAANSSLVGGGGVDGAIHRAGGAAIMRELDEIRPKIGRCPAGDAVVTGAGRLPAKYVFHAVGPVYRDGRHGEPEALASCYRKCMALANQYGGGSISFPAISTGVYGYPLEDAARIAISEVATSFAEPECGVEKVKFVLFGRSALQTYEAISRELLSPAFQLILNS